MSNGNETVHSFTEIQSLIYTVLIIEKNEFMDYKQSKIK